MNIGKVSPTLPVAHSHTHIHISISIIRLNLLLLLLLLSSSLLLLLLVLLSLLLFIYVLVVYDVLIMSFGVSLDYLCLPVLVVFFFSFLCFLFLFCLFVCFVYLFISFCLSRVCLYLFVVFLFVVFLCFLYLALDSMFRDLHISWAYFVYNTLRAMRATHTNMYTCIYICRMCECSPKQRHSILV